MYNKHKIVKELYDNKNRNHTYIIHIVYFKIYIFIGEIRIQNLKKKTELGFFFPSKLEK